MRSSKARSLILFGAGAATALALVAVGHVGPVAAARYDVIYGGIFEGFKAYFA